MSIRSKSDISFLRFLEFSEDLKEMKDNPQFIEDKVIMLFYGGNYRNKEKKVANFLSALQKPGKLKMKYKLNLSVIDKANNFIDSENFASDKDFDSLLRLLVKKRYFWQKVDVNKISITEGEYILSVFLNGQTKLSNPLNGFTIRH